MESIRANFKFEEALEKAINAGVDLLCLSNNGASYDPNLAQNAILAIHGMVKKGKIEPKRIEESWKRIMALKQTFS
jgi:beta-N-acetylhexosaminidase